MNPITFEAEMFVSAIETLSKKYNFSDAVLVKSLEKVTNAIAQFLDNAKIDIVASKTITLVECENVKHIKRIYHCTRCKTDLGKTSDKATLHLIESCGPYNGFGDTTDSRQNSETSSKPLPNKSKLKEKKTTDNRKKRFLEKQEKRLHQKLKLTKSMKLNQYWHIVVIFI